ncbi:LOW QUALITY PROTEIN: uncharacterized protein PS065_006608 [Dugong dugon]
MRNHTTVTTFILLGLTDDPQLQVVIFLLFFTYMLSITGNLTIITLTLLGSHLKTPMYFFLRNFSFLEISFTTVCIPKFLISMATVDKTISYNSCAAQLFFTILLGATEFFLLAAMSYDRYVTICTPLHYMTIMSGRICNLLIFASWLAGILIIFPPLLMGLQLDFCAANPVDHFFCDVSPILELFCTDTCIIELMTLLSAILTLLVTLVLVVLSYANIIRTILKMPSSQQRKKAFSTCSSHMVVVSISYGSCIFMYVKPSAKERVSLNKGIALLSTSVAPMLNPFIYTLRNKQVKDAFKHMAKKVDVFSMKSQRTVMGNHTRVTVFVPAGLTDDPQLKVVLFIFLLLTYLLSIVGHLIIITLTLLDTHLKTPMYFFLRNFSLLEISYTTTCIPKLLVVMATGDKTISYNCCVAQLFFAFLLGAPEFYLLAAMSYDRYVAICKPLHYTTIMNSKIYIQLVLSCWLAGFFVIFPPLILGLDLDFCASNTVDHFYCDATPLLRISCSDTQLLETMAFISAMVTLLVTLAMVLISYTFSMRNHTIIREFVPLDVSDDEKLPVVIFIFLFITYVLSVTGNLTIIILTLRDSHVKTLMYYFLQNFSFLEITFTTVSVPRFLGAVITEVKNISYNNSLAQLFFFIFTGVSEFFLLMSYDHYIATCKPLHYTTIINKKICTLFVLCSWLGEFLTIFPPLMLILQLDFCVSNVIDHFSCDYFSILQLSCTDIWLFKMIDFYFAFVTSLFTLALVVLSYLCVIITIQRISSASQRKKAFSACSSHRIVIAISYGSCIFKYVKPSAKERASLTKGVAILNTSIAPMPNPFIYTPRNQQVKQAFKDLVHKIGFPANK